MPAKSLFTTAEWHRELVDACRQAEGEQRELMRNVLHRRLEERKAALAAVEWGTITRYGQRQAWRRITMDYLKGCEEEFGLRGSKSGSGHTGPAPQKAPRGHMPKSTKAAVAHATTSRLIVKGVSVVSSHQKRRAGAKRVLRSSATDGRQSERLQRAKQRTTSDASQGMWDTMRKSHEARGQIVGTAKTSERPLRQGGLSAEERERLAEDVRGFIASGRRP